MDSTIRKIGNKLKQASVKSLNLFQSEALYGFYAKSVITGWQANQTQSNLFQPILALVIRRTKTGSASDFSPFATYTCRNSFENNYNNQIQLKLWFDGINGDKFYKSFN